MGIGEEDSRAVHGIRGGSVNRYPYGGGFAFLLFTQIYNHK
jgi:hypothetical protein